MLLYKHPEPMVNREWLESLTPAEQVALLETSRSVWVIMALIDLLSKLPLEENLQLATRIMDRCDEIAYAAMKPGTLFLAREAAFLSRDISSLIDESRYMATLMSVPPLFRGYSW